ncbi:hypothetical protein TCAL_10005 [Tigriopus californicus]|uniref:ceramide glucosyltransferase n=1 Tax=Tigriopus californicus TaxID=6832 RepID=A0A553NZL4_TIGCA|nr:ceramide glucosyltransferase-like [Tigriopus californicus]TRY70812.1 hypothetical protein TCAL_10005 [Tigriopus californicus]
MDSNLWPWHHPPWHRWTIQLWIQLVAAVVFLISWVVLRFFHILALIKAKWWLHRKKPCSVALSNEEGVPGVSIVKPLCSGADANLVRNLETFFTLNYPKFEILFCIQDQEDSRLRYFVESLIEKYPDVDAKVFSGGEVVGVNPKINNMQPAFQASQYELILVSDSGIRMSEDTLTDMVSCMTKNVGLVHQLPFICDKSGIAGTLEKVYFGTSHARIYLAADVLGFNCATGMSALMRKEILTAVGGLKAFSSYIAEDYFMAKSVLNSGFKIQVSSQPAQQNPGDSSITNFHSRITRWTKLRYAMCPGLMVFEPISDSVIQGVVCAWALFFLFRWDPVTFIMLHLLLWFIMDWALIHLVQNGPLPFSKFEFLVTWVFRELTAPCILIAAHVNPSVTWRNKRFRLKWGGVAEKVETSDPDEPSLIPITITSSALTTTSSPSSSSSIVIPTRPMAVSMAASTAMLDGTMPVYAPLSHQGGAAEKFICKEIDTIQS